MSDETDMMKMHFILIFVILDCFYYFELLKEIQMVKNKCNFGFWWLFVDGCSHGIIVFFCGDDGDSVVADGWLLLMLDVGGKRIFVRK